MTLTRRRSTSSALAALGRFFCTLFIQFFGSFHTQHQARCCGLQSVVPCLDLIRVHTNAGIGLIVPTRHRERTVNGDLSRRVDWVRSHLDDDELATCQLPNIVKLGHHAIHKPLSWYPRPDLLEPLLAEATRVKKSRGAALKWMSTPCPHLHGPLPINTVATEAGTQALHGYLDR